MTFSTIMVNLELGSANTRVLDVAAGFAERFGASVIGVAACNPMPVLYTDGYYVDNAAINENRARTEADIQAAEQEFHAALQGRARSAGFRSGVMLEPPADFVAREARSADIIVTASGDSAAVPGHRQANPGHLLMLAGRPVLAVPVAAAGADLSRVMMAWKDSRETRRAARDALPLLKRATHVVVAEVADKDDLPEARTRTGDVVAWLERQGIAATSVVVTNSGDDSAQLQALAAEHAAGVIVAGAYGHSRLREWALGGVTRDLLRHGHCCALLSH